MTSDILFFDTLLENILETFQWPPSRSATAQVWVRDSRSVAVDMAFGRYLHFPLDSSSAPSRSLLPPRCKAAGTTTISLALSYTQEVWCILWLRWTSGSPSIVLCLVYLSALRDTHRDQLSLRQRPLSIILHWPQDMDFDFDFGCTTTMQEWSDYTNQEWIQSHASKHTSPVFNPAAHWVLNCEEWKVRLSQSPNYTISPTSPHTFLTF